MTRNIEKIVDYRSGIKLGKIVTITRGAAEKFKAFIVREGNGNQSCGIKVKAREDANGRIIYDLEFETTRGKDDLIIEGKGVKLYLEPESVRHLEGSKIDYIETRESSGFTILNPNFSCGCGPDCGCQAGKKEIIGSNGKCP